MDLENPVVPVAAPQNPAPPAGDHAFDAKDPVYSARPANTSWVAALGIAGVVGLAGLFLLGFIPHQRRRAETLADSQAAEVKLPLVSVAKPRRSGGSSTLTLPGTVRAYQETSINARTSGYVKRWLVDFGDRVAQDQLLAEIEVPELDQQIDQAKASVNQLEARLVLANANVALAESTLKRYEAAAPAGGITPQELDEKRASLDVAKATAVAAKADVEAGQANLRRLVQLKEFATVKAPFAGTITARWVDVGTLVTAGNAKGQDLFHLVQANPARVYVAVPQSSASGIHDGASAEVLVREASVRSFAGKVVRTTRAIDDASKTLLADVEVPNEEGLLLPGMYTQVKFQVPTVRTTWFVPQSALVVTADGTQVIVVGEGDKLHFKTVEVDTDYGSEVSLASGVADDDRVVTNPGEKLVEGAAVRVAEPPAAAKK